MVNCVNLFFNKTQAFNLFLHRYHFRTLLQCQSPSFDRKLQARGHSSYFFHSVLRYGVFLWGTLFNMAEKQHFPYYVFFIYCAFFSKIFSCFFESHLYLTPCFTVDCFTFKWGQNMSIFENRKF